MKRFKNLDTYYVKANANMCIARWFCIDVLLFAVTILLGSPVWLILSIVACIFSVAHYWANIRGDRMLVKPSLNLLHGRHYKRFLKEHDFDYRDLKKAN